MPKMIFNIHPPYFSKQMIVRLFLLLLLFPVVSGRCAVPKHPDATPTLLWKYSWLDGNLNNTLGGPLRQSLLPKASLTLLPGGYVPSQIAAAYGFNAIPSSGDGRGQTIAIIDAYGSPNIQSDLNVFCSQFGLPQQNITILYPYGHPSTTSDGWAGETTLDVEWAHAMAPGARIVLIVAPDAGTSLDQCISYASTSSLVNATVVSMSFGIDERASSTFPSYYDPLMANKSVTFVASAGDYGAQVLWPGASSNCLSVGGTSLNYSTIAGYSETGWTFSGGGISSEEPLPSWQSGFPGIANPGRSVPDISYNADPYTGVDIYMTPPTGVGGWMVFGGTSAGAPQWAALLARAASLGSGYSNRFMSTLYGTCRSSFGYLQNIRDITTGNNGYPCLVGYDLVTGLGSPIANQVVKLSDNSGNLYVGDESGRITKVSPTGVAAQLHLPLVYPLFMVSDKSGNLYLGNQNGPQILKVNVSSGAVSTLFANGTNSSLNLVKPSGVALDAAGNLFVADSSKNQILKIATNGIASIFSTNNALKSPAGMAFDPSGNLYVVNNGNNSILKFSTNANASVFATNALNKPYGIAIDASTNVYVSNLGNSTVSKFGTNGLGGLYLSSNSSPGFNSPEGLSLDGAGNLYIANTGNNNIVKVAAGIPSVLVTSNNPVSFPVSVTFGN
jgi:streptogramin lyase